MELSPFPVEIITLYSILCKFAIGFSTLCMNEFIDTHTHLYDAAFDEDFDHAVSRARKQGVVKCIFPAIDSSSYEAMAGRSDALPDFAFPCIGLHPTSVADNWEEEMTFVRSKIKERKFYAVGEIGIDEYWSKDFLPQQKRVFAEQIELAAEYNLPIIIHSREATEDIFNTLEETKGIPVKGTFHAFSGSYETYKRILTFGDFKIGIGGVLTYKNAGIASVLEKMSMDDIVLETDCPWLTPAPFRGKRNESSYIAIIAEKVSQIKNVPLHDVALKTTCSAQQLFNLHDS